MYSQNVCEVQSYIQNFTNLKNKKGFVTKSLKFCIKNSHVALTYLFIVVAADFLIKTLIEENIHDGK